MAKNFLIQKVREDELISSMIEQSKIGSLSKVARQKMSAKVSRFSIS